MKQQIDLDGSWTFGERESDQRLPARVPGQVHLDLRANDRIPDPFYRDNERSLAWITERDWVYERSFDVSEAFLESRSIRLRCDGLDTFAAVKINGAAVGEADNMFREWSWDAKPLLKPGANEIRVTLRSPLPYQKAMREKRPFREGGNPWIDTRPELQGRSYVRKEPCNYGWDWGPMLTTVGIWRSLRLEAVKKGRLDATRVGQEHGDGCVELRLEAAIGDPEPGAALKCRWTLFRPNGAEVASVESPLDEEDGLSARAQLRVEDPQLWWPNGLGPQSLYRLETELLDEAGATVDRDLKRVGLRRLELVQERDDWGESFRFRCNGRDFFAKGANWIPADVFDGAATEERLRDLLGAAREANMNMLRVWGGGLYESDRFYELCDELGLCVWQDFMFACAAYPAHDPAFMESVRREAVDNVRRLRHHPCLALWCGNNELEQIRGLIGDEPSQIRWDDYSRLFDRLLKEVVQEEDPGRPYIPSSPYSPYGDRLGANQGLSGSCDPRWGDAHLWEVWHRRQPFEWYFTSFHRFCSEFGFQSFPEPKTVRAYTEPEDRNPTSWVMEWHQRSRVGNSVIFDYLLSWFRLPRGWENAVWLTQIAQSLAIQFAVEHWRRNQPRCMGALYWQLNDCWPVASWSSVDCFGRWKALHWTAKRFFAPALVTGKIDPETGAAEVAVVWEGPPEPSATLRAILTDADGAEIAVHERERPLETDRAEKWLDLDFSEIIQTEAARDRILWLELETGGEIAARNALLFARPKHIELSDPELRIEKLRLTEGKLELEVHAAKPALWVWLEHADLDLRWSDNFFALRPGQPHTIAAPLPANALADAEAFRRGLRLRSLRDTYLET